MIYNSMNVSDFLRLELLGTRYWWFKQHTTQKIKLKLKLYFLLRCIWCEWRMQIPIRFVYLWKKSLPYSDKFWVSFKMLNSLNKNSKMVGLKEYGNICNNWGMKELCILNFLPHHHYVKLNNTTNISSFYALSWKKN